MHVSSVQIGGSFRAIGWESRKAWEEAERRLLSIPREERAHALSLGEYARDLCTWREWENALIYQGVHLFLQAAAGLLTTVSAGQLQVDNAYGVYGGPSSYATPVNNRTFLGAGNGQVATSLSSAVSAGASSITVTAGTGLLPGDQLLLTDTGTPDLLGPNPETVFVAAAYSTGLVLPLSQPTRYAHIASRVVRHGSGVDAGLPSGSAAYKGVDAGYPVEGLGTDNNPCLIWKATFGSVSSSGTEEAAFLWNGACLGVVPFAASPPAAGPSNVGVTAMPAASVLLSVSAAVPPVAYKVTPDVITSLQYQLSLKLI